MQLLQETGQQEPHTDARLVQAPAGAGGHVRVAAGDYAQSFDQVTQDRDTDAVKGGARGAVGHTQRLTFPLVQRRPALGELGDRRQQPNLPQGADHRVDRRVEQVQAHPTGPGDEPQRFGPEPPGQRRVLPFAALVLLVHHDRPPVTQDQWAKHVHRLAQRRLTRPDVTQDQDVRARDLPLAVGGERVVSDHGL